VKWITRERVKVDRVACPWLIKKFVDPQAEFLFVPADQVMVVAEREGAIPYDVPNVEFGHHGKECSFDAIVKKHGLMSHPALVLLAKIVNGADTDNSLWNQPESAGLNAVAEGFRHLGYKDDHELNAAEWIVYDALYAYCQEMVRQGKPDPVCGSAHCCLTPYWAERLGKTEFMAHQVSARGGVLRLRLNGDRVILGGQAVTVWRGELL
jgi:hypothetical protein